MSVLYVIKGHLRSVKPGPEIKNETVIETQESETEGPGRHIYFSRQFDQEVSCDKTL